jgi:DNA-binding MarR family transcriptional regulator
MTAPAQASDLARDVWTMLSEVWLGERPRLNSQMAALGLHPMQALALRFLEPDRPRPMSALADAMRCDASNVTGIADRLEAAGLVERRPATHDRRVKTLVLTERGEDVKARVAAIWGEPPAAVAEKIERVRAAAADRGREVRGAGVVADQQRGVAQQRTEPAE